VGEQGERQDKRIAVGRFGRTRGVHGEIYVIPYGSHPERLLELEEAEIELIDGFVTAKITSASLVSDRVVFKIEGYDTPELARTLTNLDLSVTADRLEALPEGEHYAFELEGCKVELADGQQIGELKEVENYPVSDMYLIVRNDGTKFRLPAIKEFVLRIDVQHRKIVIAPPDGLLETQ